MFFGKKLKELRLKHAKMGIHNFNKAMGTSLNVKELYDIEQGYAEKPDTTRFSQQIKYALGLTCDHPDWIELVKLSKEPFVMQKMPEGIIPSPLTHKNDGNQLTKEELISLTDYVNNIAIEHNKKADEYNKKADEHNNEQ